MASKTLLVVLALALLAVALAASLEQVEVEKDLTEELYEELGEELTVADFEEYFQEQEALVEKRGRRRRKNRQKVGSCTKPDGKPCALCNLKIQNVNDYRRYIACSQAGKGTKI